MSVQVHRCRFMDCERPGVGSLAFNHPSLGPRASLPSDLRIAVGRMNGDIEIWNPQLWNCDLVIPGAEGRSVEDLCWLRDADTENFRLFSVGGSDTIVEWDLRSGLPSRFARSDSGVVWAIAPSPNGKQIAAATENGSIVIFDVTGSDGELELAKRLSGADSSLASLAWKSETEIVGGGSDGRLRVWNIPQSRIVSTMRVDKRRTRGKNNGSAVHVNSSQGHHGDTVEDDDGEETVVWSLVNIPATNQMVSGDSNGFLKVWDTRNWSLQQSFAAHEADILCLAINWNGTALYSSGLDQKIVQTRLTDPKTQRWTVMTSAVAHTHDIRDLAAFEAGQATFLISGGLEPAFVVNHMQFTTGAESYRRVISRGNSQSSALGSCLVEWNERQAQVWKITPDEPSGRKLLARARVNDEFLTSCSYDPETGLLACASLLKLRLFKIEEAKIKSLSTWNNGVRLTMWAEPEQLVCVTRDDDVVLYDANVNKTQPIAEAEDDVHRNSNLPYVNQISLLAVSKGLIATARHSGKVDVYTLGGKHVCTLPTLPEAITAIGFRTPERLIACTADRSISEFDALKGVLTSWSRLNTTTRMPQNLVSQSEPAMGVFPDLNNESRAWIWGPSWLATVDFSSSLPLRNEDEAQAAAVLENDNSDGFPHFWISNRYKPLFFAGNVNNALVVSERPDKAVEAKKFWSNRRILFS